MIASQWAVDKKLLKLVETMEAVYLLIEDTKFIQDKLTRLENNLLCILKQTVECGFFVREFTGHGFFGMSFWVCLFFRLNCMDNSGRAVAQAWSNRNQKIDDLSEAFVQLRIGFDTALSLQNTFVSTRVLDIVTGLSKLPCFFIMQ